MKIIIVEPTVHDHEPRLKLIFDYDDLLISKVKEIPGSRWSRSMKCWHVANESKMVSQLFILMKGIAFIDYSALKRKNEMEPLPPMKTILTIASPQDHELVNDMKKWMEHKRYSPSTVKTYCGATLVFIRFLKPKPVREANNDDVVRAEAERTVKPETFGCRFEARLADYQECKGEEG